MNYKILIVDDEAANLRLLERLFRRDYQVISSTSGNEALEQLKLHDVALIISDQRMPGMTGIEFLKRAAEMRQHTVRIILTGYTDVTSLVEAINSNVVYKYVTKPWINEDLQQTVVRGLEHYEIIKSQYELKTSNERLGVRSKANIKGFVSLIANALEMKEPFLHGHLRRTSNYAAAIGYRLNLDATELEQLTLTAFLHKIGRIGIVDRSFSNEENQNTKFYFERGVQLLAGIPEMVGIASDIRSCTERFDGSGTPEGLSGEQIPLFARIITAAAAYDEMTVPFSDQQKPLSHEEAVRELLSDAGKTFHPQIVREFCELNAGSKIRAAINDNLCFMNFLKSDIPVETNNISRAEILQKFKTEPLLAMNILKLANSADQASEPAAQLLPVMSKLGEATLRQLIEQSGMPYADEKTEITSKRALRRAIAAQLLAAHTNIIHPDEAYTMGLLLDVGEILLADLFPGVMMELEKVNKDARERRQIQLLGVDTAQVTQWMLEACRLPSSLTSAINSPFEEMQINTPTALLLYLADKIAEDQEELKLIDVDSLKPDALTTLKLSRSDINAINNRTNSIMEEQINERQNLYAQV